jgi:hypothetical protein
MKMPVPALALFLASLLSPAARAVNAEQERLIREAALAVMLKYGAKLELSPKVGEVYVMDESDGLAQVRFEGEESDHFYYRCAFTFDLVAGKVVEGSDGCE